MAVSLQQMLAQRNIVNLVSEFAKPETPLCNFYGVARGTAADRGLPGSEMFYWDFFDFNRTLSRGYNPLQSPPPGQPIMPRQGQGRFCHIGEVLEFKYDLLMPYRQLGKPDGTIDAQGQNWIMRQFRKAVQAIDNTREFMLGQILTSGKFGLRLNGDYWYVIDAASITSGDVTVDFGIPASQKNQLNLFGTGNIIDSSWATSSNDICTQLWNLHGATERLYGIPVTECWLNMKTFNYLRNNNSMQMGSLSSGSFVIYKGLSEEKLEGDFRQQGIFSAKFFAAPFITFRVINRSYEVGTLDNNPYSANTKLTIPDEMAVFTPPPSRDWISVAEGSRTIRPRPNDAPQIKYGFHTYEVPQFGQGAAGEYRCVADSFLIYLLSRYAICQATVTGF